MPTNTTLSSFKINGTAVTNVGTASVNMSRSMIDTTAIGDTYKNHTRGFLEANVSLELFFDAAHDAIITGVSVGTILTLAEVVWTTGKSIKGDAFVVDLNLTTAPNNVVMATANLIFSNSAITVDITA
jgi:hypothetical protein